MCKKRTLLLYEVPRGAEERLSGKLCARNSDMTWLSWLMIAPLVATVAAVTGIKPKHSRPVAHTRLMSVARAVLLVAMLIVAYMVF